MSTYTRILSEQETQWKYWLIQYTENKYKVPKGCSAWWRATWEIEKANRIINYLQWLQKGKYG